ncbi:MAG TPA: DUF3048 domain-containing protein [Actinomycetota bacterium]|nr:DUF3048 domain-containing protein [Actinomycetota bacterium]
MRGRRAGAVAGALVAVLTLAACNGTDTPPQALAGEPEPKATPDPVCPLTGLPPAKGVKLSRPAVAVKIENDPAARPQAGLEYADIVFEERVEGGITRFMAIYHCGDSKLAGPVRSGRFDDPKLSLPFTRLIAASGANEIVKAEMRKRGILFLEENQTKGLFRNPAGSTSVHSLFADTSLLRKVAAREGFDPPAAPFTFGEPQNKGKKARSVAMNFVATNTIEYRWDGEGWARYEAGAPFMSAEGRQITVPNLVIQEVRVDNSATIVDVAGNPSPDITLTGTGRAWLFRDGRVVKGSWSIEEEGGTPVFTDKKGSPFVFEPGAVWIELVPSQEGGVTGGVSISKK